MGGQVAHISAAEADLLKRRGGAGTTNPMTGLPEYQSGMGFTAGLGPGGGISGVGLSGPGGPGSGGQSGGNPFGFLVGDGGNVSNTYGKGIATFSGPNTVTTNITSPKVVTGEALAYGRALNNYLAGVPGWGLGVTGEGNAYGMTPGLTGVPGFIGGQATSYGQFLSNAIKMLMTGGSMTGILGAIGMNMAQSGQLGQGAKSIAAKVGGPSTSIGYSLANALGLPGGYYAPQVGGIASLSGRGYGPMSGITGSQQIAPSQVTPPSQVAPTPTPTSTTLSPGPTTDPNTFLADAQQLAVSAGIPIQQAIIALASSRGIDLNNIPADGIGSIGPT